MFDSAVKLSFNLGEKFVLEAFKSLKSFLLNAHGIIYYEVDSRPQDQGENNEAHLMTGAARGQP